MTNLDSSEVKDSEELELTTYLKEGGYIRKDCWLKPMHIAYSANTDTFNLMAESHTYNGYRVPCTVESYSALSNIKYAGTWVKCNARGEDLE